MRFASLSLLLFAFAPSLVGADITGTCDAVPDGDTLWVAKSDGERVKIRLVYCDAPEIDQPHGIQARDFLREKCLNKMVTVTVQGTDDFGRSLGEVLVGGENVNKSIIEEGHGWWFYHYHSDLTELGDLEVAARSAKKGLFAANAPLYPRAWRRGARFPSGAGGDGTNDGSGGGTVQNSSVFIMALLPDPVGEDTNKETVILGNGTDAEVSIDQWKLQDDDNGEFVMSGTVPAGGTRIIRLNQSLQLGNGSDEVSLVNPSGATVQTLSYSSTSSGKFIIVRE